MVYHAVPVQRRWARKIRNVLNKVKAADQDAVKRRLHAIMKANNRVEARTAARAFANPWQDN